jgi:hypothetical protein
MSIFFILSIVSITLLDFAGSGSFSISPRTVGVICQDTPVPLNRDGKFLANDLVAFRFTPGELSVRLDDEVDGLFEALSSLVERALLDVAAWQLVDAPDPPLAHALEHARVAILHKP